MTSPRVTTRTGTRYEAVRFEIPIHEPYADFRQRFESAVPVFRRDRAADLVERRASWSEVAADVKASAPHDFLLYWKLDLTPVMSLAGHGRRATEYLIGNHVTAETMYRHDPAVALYVPLHCAIYETDGGTRFAVEQPSPTLSSLGRHEIVEVGVDLDRKLAALLMALGVDVPGALLESRAAA